MGPSMDAINAYSLMFEEGKVPPNKFHRSYHAVEDAMKSSQLENVKDVSLLNASLG